MSCVMYWNICNKCNWRDYSNKKEIECPDCKTKDIDNIPEFDEWQDHKGSIKDDGEKLKWK